MMRHLDERTLNEYADATLPSMERQAAEQHLAACVSCRAEVRALEALLVRAAGLPARLEPPAELWADVLRARGGGAAPDEATPADRERDAARPFSRRTLVTAAAAALLLTALSSGTTALLLRRDAPASPVPAGAAPTARASRASMDSTVARWAPVEAKYAGVSRELARTVEERRAQLAPETVAQVERSLATIDTAIAEARAALARDPGNRDIVVLLAARWEQRLDLLRRATELPPRS